MWTRAKSLKIMFVNKMDHFFSSMHSMGLYYTKESKGSVYYNGTESVTIGNAVPPGGCFVYKWYVDPLFQQLLAMNDEVLTQRKARPINLSS